MTTFFCVISKKSSTEISHDRYEVSALCVGFLPPVEMTLWSCATVSAGGKDLKANTISIVLNFD